VERRYERLLEGMKKGAVDREKALKDKQLFEILKAPWKRKGPFGTWIWGLKNRRP
jgi:hypothetical protein